MRAKTWWIGTVLALVLAVPIVASSTEGKEEIKGDEGAPAEKAQVAGVDSAPIMIAAMPVFVPPNRGSPMARLGGATRSAGDDALPRIEALVPEQPGWTLREQPVLYWYLSKPTDVRVDFVLLRLDPTEPVLETTLPKSTQAGVQRIALADHGVKLDEGVSYQWLVKLVPNPDDRSYDRIVGGGIERVDEPDALATALEDPKTSEAHALAKNGIWYDAVDEFSTQIAAEPGNRVLWNQRAALFEQVGLPELPLEQGAAPGLERR